jgi:Tol biopolymer transport system component
MKSEGFRLMKISKEEMATAKISILIVGLLIIVFFTASTYGKAWQDLSSEWMQTDWYTSSSWSYDGRKASFVFCQQYYDPIVIYCPEIYVLRMPDLEASRVVMSEKTYGNYSPAWAPEDDRLLFVSDYVDYGDIYLWDFIKSDAVAIATNAAWEGMPAWSPDAQQIAFVSGRKRDCCQIYLSDSNGDEIQLFLETDYALLKPQWSPDGRLIATIETNDFNTIYDSLLADQIRIVSITFADVGSTWPKSVSLRDINLYLDIGPNISWSPDSTKMAFVAVTDTGDGVVYLIDVQNESYQLLTDGKHHLTNIAWSPDGNRIAFASDEGLFVINIATFDTEQLTDKSGLTPYWASDDTIYFIQMPLSEYLDKPRLPHRSLQTFHLESP